MFQQLSHSEAPPKDTYQNVQGSKMSNSMHSVGIEPANTAATSTVMKGSGKTGQVRVEVVGPATAVYSKD